jgi:hypothetical protein
MDTRQQLALAGSDKCQRLHLLQMAAEKICKAYLYAGGSAVTRTHAVVEKYLPLIFRNLNGLQGVSGTQLKQIKRISREIELLAPACDAAGSRPDNTEYPWEDALGKAQAPCDYLFPELDEDDRTMAPLLRSMRAAAERLAQ